ncbi:MAG: hypothetical protein ACP5RH_08435 [Leptodesmis sp.]|uniref:hypothetical protein n=1 Tax=Leptodesmis sp. TaxID=3100501 RepID=UPI003D12EDF3
MSRTFLPILAMGAIVLSPGMPTIFAQPAPGAPPRSYQDDTLKMVMVDQSRLDDGQRQAFQRFLQTANLPHTKIGQRCQYYGKPQVWCLLLDPPVAERVFQQLKTQSFGAAVDIRTVRRFRGVEKG